MGPVWRILVYAVLAIIAWRVVQEVRGWRYGKNRRLRRLTMYFDRTVIVGSVTIDFVEMMVFSEQTFLGDAPGGPDWPTLHLVRRTEGSRWEIRDHAAYLQHHIEDLRRRLAGNHGLDAEELSKELDTLLSGNVPWTEWSWGSQAEPAYQSFLRNYQPTTAEDDARFKLATLEELYQQRWRREAKEARPAG
jgi:hypothetical protein